MLRNPPDLLITTPESLYLMLTSQARENLRGVEAVIIDEIHALAPTKRGAHLSLTLERLDAITDAPVQRIGLSATVRPVDAVAEFLGGARSTADGAGIWAGAASITFTSDFAPAAASMTWPKSFAGRSR